MLSTYTVAFFAFFAWVMRMKTLVMSLRSANGTVFFIAEDVQPCGADPCPSISPAGRARYVLEANAGDAERLGIRVSDSAAIGPA